MLGQLCSVLVLATAAAEHQEVGHEALALIASRRASKTIAEVEKFVSKRSDSGQQVPLILHRVMLPRTDGNLDCTGPSRLVHSIPDVFRDTRNHFYEHNSGFAEYVWGQESIKALFEQSEALFQQTEGLHDFATLFNGMDQWMYQQDTIRHLILYHFGGVYMDLDMDCRVDVFDIIGEHSLVLREHGKTNFMGAAPHHEFFLKMLVRIASTFREGLKDPDHRKGACSLTGEEQICKTLEDDFDIVCWKGSANGGMAVAENGDTITTDKVSLKLAGKAEIENFSETAKCSHNSLSAWKNSDNVEVAGEPKSEVELAKECDAVYDDRTTWGAALIEEVKRTI